ncbi:MAG TPA: hypothetical protein VGP36_17645 [Mycobacteriales bacterium]|nr:hypothetical protein [Mycobacteriales bacterium]
MNEDMLRRRRQIYEQMRLTGQKLGPLQKLRIRRRLRRLVSAPPYGPPGDGRGEDGGAGVREPRRPRPQSPQGAAELPRDPADR